MFYDHIHLSSLRLLKELGVQLITLMFVSSVFLVHFGNQVVKAYVSSDVSVLYV